MNLPELLQIAIDNLKDLSTLDNPDFRLEQAEYLKKELVWEIVVSYLVENTNKPTASLMALTSNSFPYHRIYKKLKIDGSHDVIGMYIFNAKE